MNKENTGGCCLIVAGGTVEPKFLKQFAAQKYFKYIFAVDKGLMAVHRAGLFPTHLIGDFDSVSRDIRKLYEKNSAIKVERLIPEKDDTDTEHAMNMAVELAKSGEIEEIVLTGGFGTRFDHMLANVHTLQIPFYEGIHAYMTDEINRVSLISGSKKVLKEEQYGEYVSFLPLSEKVSGVTLRGFKYPVENFNFSLQTSFGLGVSNEITAEAAEIEVQKGILIMVEAKEA